jgi:hypothetical protein
LMRAAFIGRRFRPALLAGVLALDEERVRAALDEACNLQLVLAENSTGTAKLTWSASTTACPWT